MKKLFTTVFLLTYFIVFSQTLSPEENSKAHRRYWYYRTRLINDFIKIGGAQGDCIVFPERNQKRKNKFVLRLNHRGHR